MIFNFKKHEKRYEPGKLLFDYFDGQAGLPIEPGYEEITLTATENKDKIQMDVYHRPTGDDEIESRTTYIVSSKALDDVMKIVKKHKLIDWNKCRCPCLCGRKTVCKFIRNGELVRVSSDNMPQNGMDIFTDIRLVLCGYIDPTTILEKSSNDLVATLKVTNTVINTMAIPIDGSSKEPEKVPKAEIITVRSGSLFYGFTVTEIKDDFVRFNANFFRYIVNNGSIENKFTIHTGETLRLDMVDILDANDLTFVELLDVKASDQ